MHKPNFKEKDIFFKISRFFLSEFLKKNFIRIQFCLHTFSLFLAKTRKCVFSHENEILEIIFKKDLRGEEGGKNELKKNFSLKSSNFILFMYQIKVLLLQKKV